MSLTKQLWVAIVAMISLTFLSGFLVSGITARTYYEEQLRVKNIDAATSMAMTLSALEKDSITVELTLSAQFDTGHYQRIELINAEGDAVFSKQHIEENAVPTWFTQLLNFDIPVGVAQVQDGWNLYGTLYVESASAYALAALWKVALKLLFWFSFIALLCGVIGSFLMRLVNAPLDKVIAQAEALGERRFISSSEPKTIEFKRLVRAMNRLTERVRGILDSEAQKLEEIQRKTQRDEVMNIANREYFFSVLKTRLEHNKLCQDALFLIRLQNLTELNQKLGRIETDRWLKALSEVSQTVLNQQSVAGFELGRLNGIDIALIVKDAVAIKDLAAILFKAWQKQCSLAGFGLPLVLVGCYYQSGDKLPELMGYLDQQLVQLEQTGAPWQVLEHSNEPLLFNSAQQWRQELQAVLEQESVQIQCYPVLDFQGQLLQQEAMMRIYLAGVLQPASKVLGWARRVGMLALLDEQVVRLALAHLQQEPGKLAVNISALTLQDSASIARIMALLDKHDAAVRARLAFEVEEYTAMREPLALAGFAALIKQRGCTLGLQAAGNYLAKINGIEQLGIEYIKIDSALIALSTEAGTQAMLRSLCGLGHSLGAVLIAEGVQLNTNQALLAELGFDGMTGPGVML